MADYLSSVKRRLNLKCLQHDYTLCPKNVPTFKLSISLSNLNKFSKILH